MYSADRLWEKFRCFWQEKAAFSYHDYDISEKEQGIIELVAEGLSNREIAEKKIVFERGYGAQLYQHHTG